MAVTDMPTITARGPLMPNLRLKLKPIPHTCTLVPMATPMPMVLILMDTMDSELSLPTTPVALATNMFPPLPPPTMVDTMAIPDTTDTDTDTDMVLDMVVTTADTDTVVSATTVKLI